VIFAELTNFTVAKAIEKKCRKIRLKCAINETVEQTRHQHLGGEKRKPYLFNCYSIKFNSPWHWSIELGKF